MSTYKQNRTRIWLIGVREHKFKQFSPTGAGYFRTRKECQEEIDKFRREQPGAYASMEHKPMCYYPAKGSE